MMTILLSVVNRNMKKVRKYEQKKGVLRDYELINIDKAGWSALADVRCKVMKLLWSHECLFGGGTNKNIQQACIDPITLILIHRNVKNMIKRMLPEVCFFYDYCYIYFYLL